MPGRVVLLDFDGTLVRAGLRDGFPWHRHDEPHLHLSDPDSWWEPVEALIAAALLEAGIEAAEATRAARAVRQRYCDPSRGWQLFEDSLAALERLHKDGWRCAVLSNHIPELAALAILVRRSGDAQRTAPDLEHAARVIVRSGGRGDVQAA